MASSGQMYHDRLSLFVILKERSKRTATRLSRWLYTAKREMVDNVYSMLIFLAWGAVAFGTTIFSIPFFRLAFTASWSTRAGNAKLR